MSSAHRRTASQPLSTPQLVPPELSSPPTSPGVLAGAPTLLDFLHTVPSPLVNVIVNLASPVSYLRRSLEIVSWKVSWVDGCLLVAAWWAVALFAGYGLRYFLPLIAFAHIVLSRRRSEPPPKPPISEPALQATLNDFSTVLALLPASPALPQSLRDIPLPLLARATLAIYAPYLLLTYLVPLRILLAVAGTLLLTYRAPPAQLLRAALWRSAYVRWGLYRAWASLSGTPLPHAPPSSTTAVVTSSTGVRFAFTVYENQRWWVGLDWTAALLPNERPSWCDAALAPVPPPAAFALPPPTVAFLPGADGSRVKHTAVWAWEDPEWAVVVRRDGDPPETGREGEQGEGIETDAEGWVYGDNKWEQKSGKGSISKYTRYRRWARVAVLAETVEPAGPGPTGVLREDDGEVHALQAGGEPDRTGSPDEHRSSLGLSGGLRQRLQAAVAAKTHAS
ncbi:Pex24p-domain-containing protein [Artomyces pyxidatus]|uniref:Pex24p-domain-containing protein n=1 Tax=Artomyces pyxidatus TaxID=48021 RepID=A0ACB8T5K2_9AGAM|nr:Pex24p-domain-containing protein [Artomyces pyxidatus]